MEVSRMHSIMLLSLIVFMLSRIGLVFREKGMHLIRL